jgi:SAM-dependent methyltransferase
MVPQSDLYLATLKDLRDAYDRSAATRDAWDRPEWQRDERDAFVRRLDLEHRSSLLEIGAGPGQDAKYFGDCGIKVVATDPSIRMVEMARARGVDARVADVLDLDIGELRFDAAYAMNSLLHVPSTDLPRALKAIRTALVAGGLFYLGSYGGPQPFEGVLESDWHVPPRFFSFRTDRQILDAVAIDFGIEQFSVREEGRRFQSMTLRAREK